MPSAAKVNNQTKAASAQANQNGVVPKVVGPNVQGNREEYQLVRRLQSALFGGVYEAKGLSSGRDFAIKVLHKSELAKAQENNSIEFCEAPLSELRFADAMRGHEHVMEAEEHFEDAYCYYVVFELARGGDLLEALKQKPHGFDEAHAQYLIRQAALGLEFLHKRHVAMQDVSLENMLLYVNEKTGHYEVKICDPGQAVVFETGTNGEELQVPFNGLVGKSFRPPELHDHQPYLSTKVDSWCLGWSTFYLLTAQPLFMSADPSQQDADWLLFQQMDYGTLFQQKSNLCSQLGLDFIFRLLQIEPGRRMSIPEALGHAWLADPKIAPVMAPKDVWPESLLNARKDQRPILEALGQVLGNKETLEASGVRSPLGGGSPAGRNVQSGFFPNGGSATVFASPQVAQITNVAGSVAWNPPSLGGGSHESLQGSPYGVLRTPMLRARSPTRVIRGSAMGMRMPTDQQRQSAQRGRGYVVVTAHSPAPTSCGSISSPTGGMPQRSAIRTASPLQSSNGGSYSSGPSAMYRTASPYQFVNSQQPSQAITFDRDPSHKFFTPSLSSRPTTASATLSVGGCGVSYQQSVNSSVNEDPQERGRRWTFRSEAEESQGRSAFPRASSPVAAPVFSNGQAPPSWNSPNGNVAHSPVRPAYYQRSASPVQAVASYRSLSPGMGMQPASLESPGLPQWTQAPSTFSPRQGPQLMTMIPRQSSPMGRQLISKTGFAWSPDPPSPGASPRSFSPTVYKAPAFVNSTLPRWSGTMA